MSGVSASRLMICVRMLGVNTSRGTVTISVASKTNIPQTIEVPINHIFHTSINLMARIGRRITLRTRPIHLCLFVPSQDVPRMLHIMMVQPMHRIYVVVIIVRVSINTLELMFMRINVTYLSVQILTLYLLLFPGTTKYIYQDLN